MKPFAPIFFTLMLVSLSFIAVAYRVEKLSTELIIEGPTQGVIGEPLEFIFILTDPEGCEIWFYIEWDDGSTPGWYGPYMAGDEALIIHTWYECGYYTIFAGAEGCNGSDYTATLNVTIIDNQPPDIPKIAGPLSGRIGKENEYTLYTDDPDGDNVSYFMDWDDGTSTGWTDYYPSGNDIKISHTWYRKGEYQIRCKAKDVYGAESEWSEIHIPGIKISQANYDLCLFEVKGDISKSSKWQEPMFFIGKWFNKNNRYNLFLSATLVIGGNISDETLIVQDLVNEDLIDVYYGNIEIKIKLLIGVIEPSEGICKGFLYRASVY